jgi:putative ubiquitin-RnfH superfamily antitoxin RatB of RatAB toxin-antitoxin module
MEGSMDEINQQFLGRVLTEQATELKKIRESMERIESMLKAVFDPNEVQRKRLESVQNMMKRTSE